jgi:hypothetical protein
MTFTNASMNDYDFDDILELSDDDLTAVMGAGDFEGCDGCFGVSTIPSIPCSTCGFFQEPFMTALTNFTAINFFFKLSFGFNMVEKSNFFTLIG